MNLSHTPGRRAGGGLRRALGIVALAGLAVLAACGGGTSQVEDFVPSRVVALGDETSVLLPDGRKYSVNVLNGDGERLCQNEPIWTQAVANAFNFAFPECNPNDVTDRLALMAAVPGAKVADLAAQIDAQIAAGTIGTGTLATVMLGANDVWELYADYPATRSEDEILAELRNRGERLGAQINRLAERDARVIVSTVPDLGKSPFALAQREANPGDVDRAALISRMVSELNAGMRVTILNDGRFIGLVLADEIVQALVRSPSSYGLANVEDAVCLDTAPLPDCTSQTLVPTGRSNTWLWADPRQIAYGGQFRIGNQAADRARNNPF
jgi:lysophospholipase L1-like esterase